MKQICFFKQFVFQTLFHRELPVLNWLTEEKQIMQLLHLQFYCQPLYQLNNLAALRKPLPVFPFTFCDLETGFQRDVVMFPIPLIAFLSCKK